MIGGKKNKKSLSVDQMSIETVLAESVEIKGEINGSLGIRVDGKVVGDIKVFPGIILGEKSIINGDLTSDSVIIYGKLNGNVTAKELHIKNTAIINGDITVDSIEIEPGGKYNGTLKMDTASGNKIESNAKQKLKAKNLKVS